VKTPKALKKLGKVEAALSDILDRYATDLGEVREQLEAAAAALRRARSVMNSDSTGRNQPIKKSSSQGATAKKASVKRVGKRA
jgi:Skp family chaperone for outer membrane proteins